MVDQRPTTIPTTIKNKAPTARPILSCHEAKADATTVDEDEDADPDPVPGVDWLESVVVDGNGLVGGGQSEGEEEVCLCLDSFPS